MSRLWTIVRCPDRPALTVRRLPLRDISPLPRKRLAGGASSGTPVPPAPAFAVADRLSTEPARSGRGPGITQGWVPSPTQRIRRVLNDAREAPARCTRARWACGPLRRRHDDSRRRARRSGPARACGTPAGARDRATARGGTPRPVLVACRSLGLKLRHGGVALKRVHGPLEVQKVRQVPACSNRRRGSSGGKAKRLSAQRAQRMRCPDRTSQERRCRSAARDRSARRGAPATHRRRRSGYGDGVVGCGRPRSWLPGCPVVVRDGGAGSRAAHGTTDR